MSTYLNPWIYKIKLCSRNGTPLESEDITDYVGMVYLITNNITEKKYIGKKFFWSKRKLPPLKGKKRKRIKTVETDWKDYWGSSNSLLADIEKYGHVNFTRNVLYLCHTRTQCAYYEMQVQINSEALLSDKYYNDFIGGKINGKHLVRL